MNKLYRYIPILILVATAVFSACSTKKNTAGTRFWQAMNTRYNVYYNGAKHYDEQIKILEVQQGDLLDENDIERLEDIYGRV